MFPHANLRKELDFLRSAPGHPLGSVVTFVAVPVLPRACQSGVGCPAAPRFQAVLETRTGTSPVCVASQGCAAHIGAIVQGLTTWAHHHDITEGQIIVITIDPVLPYAELQGLVFCTIPLGR